MSFNSRNLTPLAFTAAPSRNFTAWHYDAGTDHVMDTGYFDGAREIVRPGDLLIVSTRNPSHDTKMFTFWETANFGVRLTSVTPA